jgi:GTP cyclohydrolase I
MSDQRKHKITFDELSNLLGRMASRIRIGAVGYDNKVDNPQTTLRIYGVPRGGVPVALALLGHLNGSSVQGVLVDDPSRCDIVVDDLIDSGATRKRYNDYPFYALIDKSQDSPYRNAWLVFPWESSDGGIEDNITRLLQFVGEDPNRGGLAETPHRAAKAWQHWCRGYGQDAAEVLKVFEDGAEGYDEMVAVVDIPFYSKCEHHMADIFGTATIAYIPDGKIVGLSKLNRVLDVFARRLQVQERLTAQVADALMDNLTPKGVGVVIKARHMCMESRGVCQQGHHTVTSALRGVFKDQPSTRAEFYALTK